MISISSFKFIYQAKGRCVLFGPPRRKGESKHQNSQSTKKTLCDISSSLKPIMEIFSGKAPPAAMKKITSINDETLVVQGGVIVSGEIQDGILLTMICRNCASSCCI